MAEQGELTRVGPAVGFLERVGLLEPELHSQEDINAGFGLLFDLAKEGAAQERLAWRTVELHAHVLTALSEDKDPARYLRDNNYLLDGVSSAALVDATAEWLEMTARIALKTTADHVPAVEEEQPTILSDAEDHLPLVRDSELETEVERDPEGWVDTVMADVADLSPEELGDVAAALWQGPQETAPNEPVTPRTTEHVVWPGGMRVPRVENGHRFERTQSDHPKGKGGKLENGSEVRVPIVPLGELPDIKNDNEEGEWQERALCAQTDPEAFFPERGSSTREAKRICQRCEVRSECLDYALSHNERFGIWGGLSEQERRKLKKRAS